MRKVLIPHQQDLGFRYNMDGINTPMILNQRFANWVNSHEDMVACVMSYDEKYLQYIYEGDDDLAVLIPGGEDLGMFPERDAFETSLVKACYDTGTPLFGICKGMQVINNFFGGTLRQSPGHWQSEPESETSHPVDIGHGTLFAKYLIQYSVPVNSYHKWCINKPGAGIEICGTAEDSDGLLVPECITVEGKPIAAVQWHPSYVIQSPVSKSLLKMFYNLPMEHDKKAHKTK